MHVEDEADDRLIADQLESHAITRSQSQAVERAKQHEIIPENPAQLPGAQTSSRKGAYTRGMQDPKHRGQMLRRPIIHAWIAAEKLEMEGLARRKCWGRILKSTLTAQDKVFSTRFHYKIKRKHGQFEKCKVRLVVQG